MLLLLIFFALLLSDVRRNLVENISRCSWRAHTHTHTHSPSACDEWVVEEPLFCGCEPPSVQDEDEDHLWISGDRCRDLWDPQLRSFGHFVRNRLLVHHRDEEPEHKRRQLGLRGHEFPLRTVEHQRRCSGVSVFTPCFNVSVKCHCFLAKLFSVLSGPAGGKIYGISLDFFRADVSKYSDTELQLLSEFWPHHFTSLTLYTTSAYGYKTTRGFRDIVGVHWIKGPRLNM